MYENKYLDGFTHGINPSDYHTDLNLKQKILQKTYKRIKNGWYYFRRIVAACMILAILSAFIPNTPVHALCQKLFSFIPGIGIVENYETDMRIIRVMEKPVKVTEGEQFIEVQAAYLTNTTLNLSIKTNVGAIDAGEFKDAAEFKKFFAGETTPKLYLSTTTGKIKSNHSIWAGPSFETRVYSIEASFHLEAQDTENQVFGLELEGFGKLVEITMIPVSSDASPEAMGNVSIIDNVIIFANASREGEILEVLFSAVAPQDDKNIRFHLFDEENRLFENGVHVLDKEGNIYLPDEGMRKMNNSDINHLYFVVPEEKEGLRVVIPQILYNRVFDDSIKMAMPKVGQDRVLNKEWRLGEGILTLEKVTLLPAHDPMMPEEMKASQAMKIDASYKEGENARERVLRVLPNVEVPDSMIDYAMVSQSTYAELWDEEPRGYSITVFDDIEKTKKVRLKFSVECTMTGPWVITLK